MLLSMQVHWLRILNRIKLKTFGTVLRRLYSLPFV